MGRRTVSLAVLWSLMSRRKNASTLLRLSAPSESRLGLFVSALAPGLAFGILVIVACASNMVPQGALVPSLLVAAVASLLSGFCYSELVTHYSNTQKETSLYYLLYQWLGEVFAFLVGWCSLLFQSCALAIVCRIMSSVVDVLLHGKITVFLQSTGLTNKLAGSGQLDFVSVVLVMNIGLLVSSWSPLRSWIVTAESTPKSWLCGLLLSVAVLTEGVFLIGAGLLWHEAVSVAPPPGGTLGWSLATTIYEGSQGEPSGLLTGAALCIFIFLAPQYTLQRFPMSPAMSSKQCNSAAHIKAHKDLPCAVVLTTFVNFLFAFALIAVLCTLRQQDFSVHSFLMFPVANNREIVLAQASWANLTITGLSLLGLVLLAIYSLLHLSSTVSTMCQDGLLPRSLLQRSLVTSCTLSSMASFFLRPSQLATTMATGPLLLNSVICICVVAIRYKKYDDRSSAVFSYNLIIGGSCCGESDKAAILEREVVDEDCREENHKTTMSDSSDEELEEDIDNIVKEYKYKLGLTQEEDQPILPPRPRKSKQPTSVTSRRADICVVSLVVCFVLLSALLEVCSAFLHRPTLATVCATISSVLATVILVLLIVLARQPQQGPVFRLSKAGKYSSSFRVPMTPWLPALGGFLNILLFVDLLTTKYCIIIVWFIAGSMVYILYGVHSSTATNAFPCIVQTPKTPSSLGSGYGPDPVRVTLEPLPIDPWSSSFVNQVVPSVHTVRENKLNHVDQVLMRR